MEKNNDYTFLFGCIDELIESGEEADDIFDSIVDHFAYKAEEAQRASKVYTGLLNKVRSNKPVDTIPQEEPSYMNEYARKMQDVISALNDPKKGIMLEKEHNLKNFVEDYTFPNE